MDVKPVVDDEILRTLAYLCDAVDGLHRAVVAEVGAVNPGLKQTRESVRKARQVISEMAGK